MNDTNSFFGLTLLTITNGAHRVPKREKMSCGYAMATNQQQQKTTQFI